jgi:hypothetical protein
MPLEALLTDIRLELAHSQSVAALWGMTATTVGITAAMIGVFVDFLTYLQAFHASTVSLSSITACERRTRMAFTLTLPIATLTRR